MRTTLYLASVAITIPKKKLDLCDQNNYVTAKIYSKFLVIFYKIRFCSGESNFSCTLMFKNLHVIFFTILNLTAECLQFLQKLVLN